ncbi:hypothetical protein FRZ44_21100 [Hypericibacter terrae]|uniref:histidine kinase n=1 Tax=Hypericibacter terrae TaxID=2602015 RepID=A0A5J6MJZ8_9PROT|nr:hypothetical protein FRZ44_21100 [Hypericibacter terrae]
MKHQAPSAGNATSTLLPIVAAAFALCIFIADTVSPLEITVAVLYVAVVLLSARFCRARGVLLVALGCAALTLLSAAITPPPGPLSTGIVNIFISILAIGGTAFLALQSQSAQAALRERADLLDLSHDAIFSCDMNHAISYWSRGAEELYGWKAEEAVGKVSHELLATVFPVPVGQINAELERMDRWEGELVHGKRDGTRIVVTSRWLLQRDKRGRPAAILSTSNDITERKRAEERLRRSEAYLADEQRLSHTGSFGWSVSSNEIYWSEETFRILEHDRASPPTVELVLQRTHPDDRALVQETLDRAQREGTAFDIEHRALMPDGAVKHLRVIGRAVATESGALEFAGAVMDITARKRSEEALRRSEAYLAAAQRLSRTGSWAWNATTRELTHWSQEQYRIHGLDPKNGVPSWEDARQHIHPEDRAGFVDSIERAVREATDCELDYRSVLPDGTVRYIHTAAHPVFDGAGNLVEFVGTDMDTTDRKRAEILIGQVFEKSPDGVAIIGRDYRYRRVNPIYERNWKIPAERFIGMLQADLTGKETFERTIKPHLDRCFAGEEVGYREWFSNKFGRRFMAVSYSPLWLGSDRVEAALVISRDLTEHMVATESLHEAQAALAHVNRVMLLGEMVASIAHEVNQPIAAVVANAGAGLLWLGAPSPNLEEAREALESIVNNGKRAGDVIGRIRSLVKKTPPSRDALDINETIFEVVRLARSDLQKNRVVLQTHLSSGLPPVRADRVQVQQVIFNLLANAVEAMGNVDDRTREIVVRSGRSDADDVLIDVRDSGPGFDPANLTRLFQSFYTTKPNGMGMGLAISRSIVEAHGGRLWATPNEPHGAVFCFTLPIAADETTGVAAAPSPRPAPPGFDS